ncbi:hypothetical protein KOW79_004542 [Hemibagrus wyckioides]|uniref:Uncharacterized protein n=1 Tax=Hemibagrus wyckioides TaxID=337641 RepID=A0A9D3P148_9TELE|nr:hypothetical protein KOW79_004542 [Hemibagrus wyckioides]
MSHEFLPEAKAITGEFPFSTMHHLTHKRFRKFVVKSWSVLGTKAHLVHSLVTHSPLGDISPYLTPSPHQKKVSLSSTVPETDGFMEGIDSACLGGPKQGKTGFGQTAEDAQASLSPTLDQPASLQANKCKTSPQMPRVKR